MNHAQCRDLIGPSLDGELDPQRARLVAAHIAECAQCRARRDELAAVSRGIQSLDRLPMPEDLKASLRARAVGGPAPTAGGRGFLASPWGAASLAAAALVVVVVVLSVRSEPVRVAAVASPVEDAAARADDASNAGAGGRRPASPQEKPDGGPTRPPERATEPAPKRVPGEVRDEITRRRATRQKSREEAETPSADLESAEAVKPPVLPRPVGDQARSEDEGYLAPSEPASAAPAFGLLEAKAKASTQQVAGIPAGRFATTLLISEGAVSFAPLAPQPGARTGKAGMDAPEISWRIETSSGSLAEEPEVSGRAAKTASGAASQPTASGREELGALARRTGPEQKIVVLIRVDDSGLIVAADAAGARMVEPEIEAAVTRVLRGSSLVPYTAGLPASFSLEITLPSTGRTR